MTDSLQARRTALNVLQQIIREKKQAGSALDKALSDSGLEKRDRAFATTLVMGVLRYIHPINRLLAEYVSTPLEAKGAGYVQDALRLGVAQLLVLNVPPHAAVHSSVELVKNSKFKGFAKLANGVLQSIQRTGHEKWQAYDLPKLATPEWLWNRWLQDWGKETAAEIAAWNLKEPAIDVTVKANPESWVHPLGGICLPNGSVRLRDHGNIAELEGYKEGEWWVQDAAASLPARLFSDLEGKKVLDLCAAPGGKTAQLVHAGAIVTAVDKSAPRLKRVKENLARLQLTAQIEPADILNWKPKEKYDAILLDAPCSATGTIRRHPDVILHKQESDIEELAALQRKMLLRALDWLNPGGELVYSTCSLEKAEGEDHMEAVLKQRSDIKLIAAVPEKIGVPAQMVTAEGYVRTHPYHIGELGGIDGFFAAKIRKDS